METEIYKVDKELRAIELTLDGIRFRFDENVFDFGSAINYVWMAGNLKNVEEYEPWKKIGNLNKIWNLINVHSTHAAMDQVSLKLFFNNVSYIECPNLNTVPEQVNIWGGDTPGGGVYLYNYPNDHLLWLQDRSKGSS